MNRKDIKNQQCLQFIQDHLDYNPMNAKWFKMMGRYTYLSFDELLELSNLTNVPIRELVTIHGFGSSTMSIDDMETLLEQEGEGYELTITEYVSHAA